MEISATMNHEEGVITKNKVNVSDAPFHTQPDRRHEITTNRKSVKNCRSEYIGLSLPYFNNISK